MLSSLYLCLLVLAGTNAGDKSGEPAAAGPHVDGHWRNQRGSTLDITIDATGALQGSFVGKDGKLRTALVGRQVGNAVTFFIKFSEVGEPQEGLISWTGHLVQNKATSKVVLQTLWMYSESGDLRRDGQDNETGFDIFER